eukprot:TRINITY_DN27681_c0_g1_i2.p1 TRINITY_DN27681_c0_g1~~TRINITY_DN27681_c0_g1_i2.p1  ORF type:complete len:240 (+),score=52.14 TRINITY_DN27681_c0_g1_i2:101-820(+)
MGVVASAGQPESCGCCGRGNLDGNVAALLHGDPSKLEMVRIEGAPRWDELEAMLDKEFAVLFSLIKSTTLSKKLTRQDVERITRALLARGIALDNVLEFRYDDDGHVNVDEFRTAFVVLLQGRHDVVRSFLNDASEYRGYLERVWLRGEHGESEVSGLGAVDAHELFLMLRWYGDQMSDCFFTEKDVESIFREVDPIASEGKTLLAAQELEALMAKMFLELLIKPRPIQPASPKLMDVH